MIEKEILSSKKLYYDDSEMYEFDAVVISCELARNIKSRSNEGIYAIELDKTAFFPEGGGQYGDTGYLDDVKVLDTQENDGKILHITKTPIDVGFKVYGVIDKDSRFDKMQQHSGEHIVSGLVHKLFGYNNVGFHLGDDVTTLDFDGTLTSDQIIDIEKKANEAVVSNIPIIAFVPSKEQEKNLDYRSKIDIDGDIRLVQISGYDLCACCAPHVKLTGEIGLIKIVDSLSYKGGTRLIMLAGFRAIKDYNLKQSSTKTISTLLSVPIDKVADTTRKLYDENYNLKYELVKVQEESLMAEINDIIDNSVNGVALKISNPIDINVARKFVNNLIENGVKIGAIFVKKSDFDYQYIIASKEVNLKEYSSKINDSLNGRGGGKPEMIQGSVKAAKEDIKEKINNIFA